METARKRIIDFVEIQGIPPKEFLSKTGLAKGFVDRSHVNSSASDVYLSKILEAYPDISAEWLLTGKGTMLKDKAKASATPAPLGQGIPLIPVEAFAGAAVNNGYAIDFDTIEDRYNVPLFDGKGVDFMMYVRGSSMYPKYSSGDVVACRFVRELLFIQWNKVYVVDSNSQGAMIKRLLPSENPDNITCRSDNKEYIDFEIPRHDINNIALVVGCIRLE